MALELPGWVVIAFNYAGLPWPGIDEDELRAWAASVRKFAGNVTDNSARTRAVAAGLADSQQSSFTASMAARWEHHDQLIADLHEPLNVFADALDVAADVVVAQKMVVIGAAIAFATEFAATQVGAIFTLGADEAALPEEIISTREIVDFAIEELKGALIGELLNGAVAQVNDHISRFIGNLLTGGLQVVVEYESLKISYKDLRSAASAMRGQASETEETGDSAYAENANRDLEDPGEGGAIDSGWASVVQAVKQALLDLALSMFKSLPQAIMRAQEDSAAEIEGAAARIENADSAAGQAAPHDSGQGPSAVPAAGSAPAGPGTVESEGGLRVVNVDPGDGATATAPVAKFSDYLFKEGATHGKDAVFRSYGYSGADSEALAAEFEQQAATQYSAGNYQLGKLDQYGQRITIPIELRGEGAAAGRSALINTGWMIRPDGSITLNTPFSGFAK